MASIEAAKLPAAALRALREGKPVRITEAGKTIATVRAERARPLIDPKRELAAIRKADRGDDWKDFLDWPAR